MGQFQKFINFDKVNISNLGSSNITVLDLNGTQRNLQDAISGKQVTVAGAFYVYQTGTTKTSASDGNPFPYASSNTSIPYSQTSIPNQVGNCTIAFTRTGDNKGWDANITIIGNQDATVNSILFTKKLYASSNYYECLLFAYILDAPIELNAENNYTANLTMSVSFG